MAIFLDTSFFMGLVNPKDKFYSRSNELLEEIMARKFGQAYTSTYVMLEASTLAANRTHNNTTILAQIRSLFLGDLQIATLLHPNMQLITQAWDLFLKINVDPAKKPISYVDCSNISYCRYRKIPQILAYDAHFDGWVPRIY
ncbi:MAG: type II toxin-antitoxin system VapC family toxin [Promethearchaeota archaeon]